MKLFLMWILDTSYVEDTKSVINHVMEYNPLFTVLFYILYQVLCVYFMDIQKQQKKDTQSASPQYK